MLRPKRDSDYQSSAAACMEALLTPTALASLTAPAGAVPETLWSEALRAPVMELLQRPGKGFRRRLAEIAHHLAGGQGAPPSALGAALEVIHAGSMIVDDIEDGSADRRGGPTVHALFGLPLALNAGNFMYFAPLVLLGELGLPPLAELQLLRRATRTLLECHHGQALDLAARPENVPQGQVAEVVRTISTLKSGRLLGLSAEAAAICAGATLPVQRALHRFGEALGVGLQMLDDLGNLSGKVAPARRYEDLKSGRVTWAWAWAAGLLDEAAFSALVSRAPGSPESVAATLRVLVSSHGRLYAHWHLCEALAELRDSLPADRASTLQALEGEIVRLEASYG